MGSITLRLLTWNLKHGRSVPSSGRDLLDEFARALAGWSWDVALLQEAPPWWPALLGARLGASARLVLTSRNELLPLRRAIAERWPDVIKSGGGGSNAILVRSAKIVEHRTLRLALLPERRQLQAVRLEPGIWIGNLHATAHNARAAASEAERGAATILQWAAAAPAVLGGDFNLRSFELSGFARAASHDVDHLFVAGLQVSAGAEVFDRGTLSDHAPVAVAVAVASR